MYSSLKGKSIKLRYILILDTICLGYAILRKLFNYIANIPNRWGNILSSSKKTSFLSFCHNN